MVLPAFVEVPSIIASSPFVNNVPPKEWEECIDMWILLAEAHLRLSESEWHKSLVNDASKMLKYLLSYFRASSYAKQRPDLWSGPKSIRLRKLNFLLSHRALSMTSPPVALLSWEFLTAICAVFSKNEDLKKLLAGVWKRGNATVDSSIQQYKEGMIKMLVTGELLGNLESFVHGIPLLHQSPDIAAFLMTGSDLIDSIDGSYKTSSPEFQKLATLFTYLGFLGLLTCSYPSLSTFSDHLYSLKLSSKVGESCLLADLATNTPLAQKISEIVSPQDATKARKLEQLLAEHSKPGTARRKNFIRRRVDKGKSKAKGENVSDHGAFADVHVHRMSLITQIQDLFPDLGSGFIVKLLDEYNEDVEQVTAHLLDDSLPPHLQGLDRSVQLPGSSDVNDTDLAPHLIPHSTPPPPSDRRNIYDNDELDQLAVDTSRLRLGRANKNLTADALLSDRSTAPNKAAILSALAAFDSDDDERDDTYDAEDVGGMVDNSVAGNEDADTDKNEEALFSAYRMSPDTFARDSATRRGKFRIALKSETGMTDETIEGWAVMLSRDPRKLRRLEAKYAAFGEQQNTLERTSYRQQEDDESEQSGDGFGGRGRGRGRGGREFGGGRGRGGSVAGPASEAGTQKARLGKEANKGSRANHNRRDQRARKMARGGFPG